jgi:hypothetical protein
MFGRRRSPRAAPVDRDEALALEAVLEQLLPGGAITAKFAKVQQQLAMPALALAGASPSAGAAAADAGAGERSLEAATAGPATESPPASCPAGAAGASPGQGAAVAAAQQYTAWQRAAAGAPGGASSSSSGGGGGGGGSAAVEARELAWAELHRQLLASLADTQQDQAVVDRLLQEAALQVGPAGGTGWGGGPVLWGAGGGAWNSPLLQARGLSWAPTDWPAEPLPGQPAPTHTPRRSPPAAWTGAGCWRRSGPCMRSCWARRRAAPPPLRPDRGTCCASWPRQRAPQPTSALPQSGCGRCAARPPLRAAPRAFFAAASPPPPCDGGWRCCSRL